MKTEDSTGEKKALLLDFQLARCAGVVSDLSFFIYSCTDKKLRDKYFDDLLKYYYNELSQTILALGSDPNKLYPWNLFLKEVKEEFIHGMIFCFESIPFSVMEGGFDLDVIKGNNAVDIADVWLLKPIEDPEKRHRLADIIVHAIQHGFV